jgi:predicted metal-dependent hydrolase
MIVEDQVRTLEFGSSRLQYTLHEGCDARFKVEVFPDLQVKVFAPTGKTDEELDDRLRKKAGWIFRSLAELSTYHPLPTPKRYRSGETVYYLGRQYALKVFQGEEASVKLRGGNLEVQVPCVSERQDVCDQVRHWYRVKANAYFPERVKKNQAKMTVYNMGDVPVRIRAMKTRWGSCSPNGMLTLNPELVKTPSHCIDYVILHELCHLKILNHSQDFYRLLTKVCPDWSELKKRLNTFGSKI